MKLLYLNKINTNKRWGAENFLNEAFGKINVETICLDYEQHKYHVGSFIKKINNSFDAVLVQRGVGYNFPVSVLQNINRPKILLFTELVKRNTNQHYLLKANIFDHIFVRSQECYDFLLANKWVNPEQLSIQLSAALNVPLSTPSTNQDIDVLFVGALTERRKSILNKLGQGLNITVKSVFGKEFYQAIQRSKIVLNLHGSEYLDTETRIFETLSCRGFIITEKLAAESPFVSGKHLIECDKVKELTGKIAFYLNHPELRHAMANQGFDLVHQQHTYHHRAVVIKVKFNQIISRYALSKPIVNNRGLLLTGYEENGLRLKDYGYGQMVKHYQFSKKLFRKIARKKTAL